MQLIFSNTSRISFILIESTNLIIIIYRHVVQGGPIANHLNRGVNLRKPFVDHDLFSVSFQEYHPDFPHVKYTLGYGELCYDVDNVMNST